MAKIQFSYKFLLSREFKRSWVPATPNFTATIEKLIFRIGQPHFHKMQLRIERVETIRNV